MAATEEGASTWTRWTEAETDLALLAKKRRVTSLVTGLIGIVVATVSLSILIGGLSSKGGPLAPRPLSDIEARKQVTELRALLERESKQLSSQTADLEAKYQKASEEITRLSSGTFPGQQQSAFQKQFADVRVAVEKSALGARALNDQLSELDKRIRSIETVILSDPNKALAVPLLQRDIQSVGQQVERGLAAARADNDRVYDLMKWVLGLMGLVSLGLLGTAVGNVFFKREAPKDVAKRK